MLKEGIWAHFVPSLYDTGKACRALSPSREAVESENAQVFEFELALFICTEGRMKSPDRRYRPRAHFFVCTNQRHPDAPMPSCAGSGGELVAAKLREVLTRSCLRGKAWVTQTGCLTFCNSVGATVVVWPQGIWFTEVRPEDVPSVVDVVCKELEEEASPRLSQALNV